MLEILDKTKITETRRIQTLTHEPILQRPMIDEPNKLKIAIGTEVETQ